MKAVRWYGKKTCASKRVPDPTILNPRDAIVKVTTHRDLRLGPAPVRRLHPDHEGRATSSATSSWARSSRSGREVTNLKVGDRVVVPFTIACGALLLLQEAALVALRQLEPQRLDGREALRLLAASGCSATRTCSAATPAGRPSTCACRSPTSGRSRCPTTLTDEQVLFLSDIFPTGYMAAENCNISRATRSRSGAAGRSASSRSRARICSAPSASSRSTGFRSGSTLAARQGKAEV